MLSFCPMYGQKASTNLVLYVRFDCPYCKNVLSSCKDLPKKVQIVDISVAKHRKYLEVKGGKVQVPCLFIDDKPLYESKQIIAWWKQNKDEI